MPARDYSPAIHYGGAADHMWPAKRGGREHLDRQVLKCSNCPSMRRLSSRALASIADGCHHSLCPWGVPACWARSGRFLEQCQGRVERLKARVKPPEQCESSTRSPIHEVNLPGAAYTGRRSLNLMRSAAEGIELRRAAQQMK
jgi:hypothetical protein